MPWNCGFRQSFRLFPSERGSDLLDCFLGSDGKTETEILKVIPTRSGAAAQDAKRYREPRQLFRTIGLIYDLAEGGERRLVVTSLGNATRRWRPDINIRNAPVLGQFAAQALSACQLRNPTPEARSYGPEVQVFPFAFIWRAMLALEGRLSSEELNCGILHAMSGDALEDVIGRIKAFRKAGDKSCLHAPVVPPGPGQNDRLIPWMAWASFGWILIQPKGGSEYYTVAPKAVRLLNNAASIKRKHQEFSSETAYIEHVAAASGLPKDMR